jgi:6-phosphogluconolactonase (cycloisomerase 2 family)
MNSGKVLVRMVVVLGIVSAVFLAGCGGGMSANTQPPPPQNPTPAIATISPTSTAAGSPGSFTLTVNGTNFVATSTVDFGGMALTTTFVSSRQLTSNVPAAATLPGSVAVIVTNPAPGGGTSNAVNFTFTGNNPLPTVSSLNPGASAVGGGAFTLTVSGSNFVPGSVVRWNGSGRPTTFVSSSQLTGQISASDVGASGVAAITVFSPAPGGGSSNSVTFSIVTGVGPVSVVVAPDPTGKFGKFAYVANSASNNISMYTISPTTGALTFIGTIAARTNPESVTVDPSGKFAYLANISSDNISMYTIDAATGALTSAGITTAGVMPGSVTVHPSGKFAYVTNFGSNNISMYTIDSVGALTPTGMVAAGTNPASVTVHTSGKFAYVANVASNNVSMYAINSATGALTSTGMVAAGMRPNSAAVHPSGNFAYVTNCGDGITSASGGVSTYTINSTSGALTSLGSADAGSEVCPSSAAVLPSGGFVYVIDEGDINGGRSGVSLYTVDASTGKLTLVGLAAAGGACPVSIALDPSAKFAYVVDNCSNDILMYAIDPTTGALTLIGTVGT